MDSTVFSQIWGACTEAKYIYLQEARPLTRSADIYIRAGEARDPDPCGAERGLLEPLAARRDAPPSLNRDGEGRRLGRLRQNGTALARLEQERARRSGGSITLIGAAVAVVQAVQPLLRELPVRSGLRAAIVPHQSCL